MARSAFTTTSAEAQLSQMYRDSDELFTAYMNSFSPFASDTKASTTPTPALAPVPFNQAVGSDEHNSASLMVEPYQIRTLNMHNMARVSLLPMFPVSQAGSAATQHLLMANVPIEALTEQQYARIRQHAYPVLFKLEMKAKMKSEGNDAPLDAKDSFMWYCHEHLYVKTKQQLKIDTPLIDYNLVRLRKCLAKVAAQRGYRSAMLPMEELPLALEFYLQIDADMFFLKTCSYNGAQARTRNGRYREGVFCLDTPEARFAIEPCNNRYCLCCRSPCPRRYPTDPAQTLAISFSVPHIHRFVNQYEAILHCPATCETQGAIYVLTCPCNQLDYIEYSEASFAKALAHHREEGNRIMREFLLGDVNCEHLTHGSKSAEKRANDQSWLYQHSARCSAAMQLFLDENPNYWCFVPTALMEINTASGASPKILARRALVDRMPSSPDLPRSQAPDDEEVRFLVSNVPEPPLGFGFSHRQRQEQARFFKWALHRIVPANNVDLYNADIIAVLPEHCSALFPLFVESLLITHAECKLNQTGHLLQENSDPNRSLPRTWCANLIRRSPY